MKGSYSEQPKKKKNAFDFHIKDEGFSLNSMSPWGLWNPELYAK